MKRRDLIKNISIGASALGFVAVPSTELVAAPPETPIKVPNGRLKEEAIRDAKLNAEKFFTPQELQLVTVLGDIIIPADAISGSASQSGVPAFIEFMMKDQPSNQTKMRGGLAWIDREAKKRFQKKFIACTKTQQIEIVEDIAYPNDVKPEFSQGASFFTLMRNMVVTGFYSSQMGHKDIGYMGNTPNKWEGVPEEVVKKYGLEAFNV